MLNTLNTLKEELAKSNSKPICTLSTNFTENTEILNAQDIIVANNAIIMRLVSEPNLFNIPVMSVVYDSNAETPYVYLNIQVDNVLYILCVRSYVLEVNTLNIYFYDYNTAIIPIKHPKYLVEDKKKNASKKLQKMCSRLSLTKNQYLDYLKGHIDTVSTKYFKNSQVVNTITLQNKNVIHKALGYLKYEHMEKAYLFCGITITKNSTKDITLNF